MSTLLGFIVDRVITGNGDDVHEKCMVVIDTDSGKIVSVEGNISSSTSSNYFDNSSVKVFTLPENATLLPGFIDCHVHLTIPPDDYQMDHLRTSSAEKSLRALKAAQGLLQAGFTTLRSAGDADTFYPSFAVAKSINKGDFVGPTIVGAGHYISVTGGGGDINFLSADNCPGCCADGVIADGRDQMIAAVRKEIKYGSDWIKLLVTGAFAAASTGSKDSPENIHFSNEELVACVEEARKRKVHVMAHAHGAQGIVMAANAGCRSIEHASFIDADGIDACLRHGTWIVPTFLIGLYFTATGSASGAQDRMIQLQVENDERYFKCISTAVVSGVKVALGSDFVGWDPLITAREFRCMVERGGMTPIQSILAGTSSAADMLELNDSIGRVEVGLDADLVIVMGNPLDDISLLETGVVLVIKRGVIVRDDLKLLTMKV
eukprot:gene5333-7400_t